ncbi:MAG: hypothetical protein HY866_13435 [Chloroflexi bacterium]|nr:hypothetical protein [Chloroflexota bacterium]
MGIGDSITLVSCLAGFMAALPALLIFLTLLFSRTTARAARRLERGAILPFFVGLGSLLVIGFPASGMIALGSIFQLAGVLIIMVLLLWAFTGLAAVARLVGSRLYSASFQPDQPITEIALGAGIVSLAVAFPLLGWLLVLPFGAVAGVGATLLTRFSRRRSEPARYADPIPAPDFDAVANVP